jgi:hypothetical protein
MGLIYADVELVNTYDLHQEDLNLISKDEIRSLRIEKILVCTEPMMLAINETMQAHLQCSVIDKRILESANGEQKEYDIVGPIEIRVKNRRTICQAIVLPGDSEPLLGTLLLSGMDILIDPSGQELILHPLRPIKVRRSFRLINA